MKRANRAWETKCESILAAVAPTALKAAMQAAKQTQTLQIPRPSAPDLACASIVSTSDVFVPKGTPPEGSKHSSFPISSATSCLAEALAERTRWRALGPGAQRA